MKKLFSKKQEKPEILKLAGKEPEKQPLKIPDPPKALKQEPAPELPEVTISNEELAAALQTLYDLLNTITQNQLILNNKIDLVTLAITEK